MFGSLPGSIFLENILKRSESSQASCGRPQKKGYSNEYPFFAESVILLCGLGVCHCRAEQVLIDFDVTRHAFDCASLARFAVGR